MSARKCATHPHTLEDTAVQLSEGGSKIRGFGTTSDYISADEPKQEGMARKSTAKNVIREMERRRLRIASYR